MNIKKKVLQVTVLFAARVQAKNPIISRVGARVSRVPTKATPISCLIYFNTYTPIHESNF